MTTHTIARLVLVGFVVLGLGSRPAPGWVIYTVENSGDRLVTVDSNDAAATIVGPIGFDSWSWGLSFSPVPVPAPGGGTFPVNTLFGVETESGVLYQINTSTGHANRIGALGTTFAESLAFAADGTLFTVDDSDLYRVNTATGAATFVRTIRKADGLSFSPRDLPGPGGSTIPAGTMFGIDTNRLFTLDLVAGTWSMIGTGPGDESIAFAPDGTLWSFGWPPGDLYRLSTVDAGGSYMGSAGQSGLWGAAIPIPEPATLSLLVIGGLALGSFGGLGLVRNRRANVV